MVDGEIREAFAEGPAVLVAEHRRGHQDGHLLAALDGLEGRAHGQFGLAVAHVAAEQAVHRPRPLHVALDLAQGRDLVGRLLIGKALLEFLLPVRVRLVSDAAGQPDAGPGCRSSSAARSWTLAATLSFCFCHFLEPTLLRLGRLGLEPMYFWMRVILLTET